jgi:hypothetical protein
MCAFFIVKTVADGESLLTLCYRSKDPNGPPYSLHVCNNSAPADNLNRTVLDREPESYRHVLIFIVR